MFKHQIPMIFVITPSLCGALMEMVIMRPKKKVHSSLTDEEAN